MVNLYDKNIFFCIVFGIDGTYSNNRDEDQFEFNETCKNGITCASQVLRTVKGIAEIQGAFVGVSTGIINISKLTYLSENLFLFLKIETIKDDTFI